MAEIESIEDLESLYTSKFICNINDRASVLVSQASDPHASVISSIRVLAVPHANANAIANANVNANENANANANANTNGVS